MPVRLTPSQTDDIARVCRIGTAALNRVVDSLDQGNLTIKRSTLRGTIAGVVGDQEVAAAVTRVLIGLATVIRRNGVSTVDLLDAVGKALTDTTWTESELRSWHECQPIIGKLLCNKSVLLSAKALDLSYDFRTVYTNARILTDIRPVYDDEKDSIIGAVLTQTLRIEYASDDGDGSVSLVLDNRDIEQLKTICEEALRKGTRARELAQEKLQVEVIIPGEGPQ